MMYELADTFKNLRLEKGWSQQDLAQRLQVSQQTIDKWERHVNNIPLYMVFELAKQFEVEVRIQGDKLQVGQDLVPNPYPMARHFQEFDVEAIKKEYLQHVKQELEEDRCYILNELDRQCFWFENEEDFDEVFMQADFCLPHTSIQIGRGCEYELELAINPTLRGYLFNLPRFIQDLKANYPKEIGEFIEKALIYLGYHDSLGQQWMRWVEEGGERETLQELCPALIGYESIIVKQLSEDNYLDDFDYQQHATFLQSLMPMEWAWWSKLGFVTVEQSNTWQLSLIYQQHSVSLTALKSCRFASHQINQDELDEWFIELTLIPLFTEQSTQVEQDLNELYPKAS